MRGPRKSCERDMLVCGHEKEDEKYPCIQGPMKLNVSSRLVEQSSGQPQGLMREES